MDDAELDLFAPVGKVTNTPVSNDQAIPARVEAALVDAAIGGTSWQEAIGRDGDIVRLERYRAPDVAAAKALLAAHAPDKYGQQAMPITVNNSLMVATDPRVVARLSELLGISYAGVTGATIEHEK